MRKHTFFVKNFPFRVSIHFPFQTGNLLEMGNLKKPFSFRQIGQICIICLIIVDIYHLEVLKNYTPRDSENWSTIHYQKLQIFVQIHY